MAELPDEIKSYIFQFLCWKCHTCKCNITQNNINKISIKYNSKFIFCSEICYNCI